MTVKDERGPYVVFYYVCVAAVREGLPALLSFCVYLLKSLNVRWFPPPSSLNKELCYIGAETREEGGTCCRRALAAERDHGAEEVLVRVKTRWDGELAVVLLSRGGVAAVQEGAEESPPFAVGRCLLPSAMFGEEQGTGEELTAALSQGAIAGRQEMPRPP